MLKRIVETGVESFGFGTGPQLVAKVREIVRQSLKPPVKAMSVGEAS
jgi:hypothetical protein